MNLSDTQLNHFSAFGFLKVPELFSASEIQSLTAAFEEVLKRYGRPKQGNPAFRETVPVLDHDERLCQLLDDDRVTGIASSILGEDFNYASSDGNQYIGDTGWHPDGDHPDLFAIKMAWYLDPLTRTTGALRVLPGSHRWDSIWRGSASVRPNLSNEQWGLSTAEIPGDYAIETNPGDLLIFNHNLFHSSFGGRDGRRMFTMNLVRHAATPDELKRVDDYVRIHSPTAHGFTLGGMYGEAMLRTADARRLTHLRQMIDCHNRVFAV